MEIPELDIKKLRRIASVLNGLFADSADWTYDEITYALGQLAYFTHMLTIDGLKQGESFLHEAIFVPEEVEPEPLP